MIGTQLETLTWPEAEAALTPDSTILIPLGARLKEHGFHLPLNNDWLMAEHFSRLVLERAPVIALPTLIHGYYPAFLGYPGSVSIGLDAFRESLVDVARSICAHGPRRVYFLNTGISTIYGLEQARQVLLGEGLRVDYLIIPEAVRGIAEKIRQQPLGSHADELETSIMLHLAPEIVRMERAIPDVNPERLPAKLLHRDPTGEYGVYSPSGAWGDPTLATVEKGKLLVEAIVSHVVARIQALSEPGFTPDPPRARWLPAKA